jgi:hypothetical protein
VLEPRAVRDVEADVRGRDEKRFEGNKGGERKPGEPQHRGERQRRARADVAPGKRPGALFRMEAVGIAVGEIVHDVHRARNQAKRGEQGDRIGYEVGVRPAVAEHEPDEDEPVLDPLVGPHQPDQCARHDIQPLAGQVGEPR